MRKLSLLLIITIFILPSAFAATYFVNSEKEFQQAIPKLVPGDEVVIKNGIYSNWAIEIPAKGTLKAPILIRAEHEGQVVFSGDVIQTLFKLSGSYLTLKGLSFANCTLTKSTALLILNNAEHCVITNCSFTSNTAKTQFTPLIVVSGNGNANQISNSQFTSNTDNQDVQVKITKESSPLNTIIEHNIFENKARVSWKNGNGGECVQVGQDPVLLGGIISKTTVRFNRFVKCNGEPEIISNKSSSNTYFKNDFEDNDGELVMRGGHDCIIDGNTFKGGSGGIRINGTGHTIINNQINNIKTAIRLMYGMAKGKTDVGFYIAASNCIIKNNQISEANIGILVGDSKDADWTGKFDTVRYPSPLMQNIAPFENEISGNTFIKTQKNRVSL